MSNLAGGSLSGLQSVFPLLSSSDQVTVNFANSKFENFAFTGTTSILGNFITTGQSFKADANLDFTIAGTSTVNFANSALSKLINVGGLSFGGSLSTNYLVSYNNAVALSADYAAAWFNDTVTFGVLGLTTTTNFTIGVKATFDGNISTLIEAPSASSAVPAATHLVAAKAEASGASNSAASYLFLTSSWTNAATQAVNVTVTDPLGNVIPESGFAADGIAVVSVLSTAYQETLAVMRFGIPIPMGTLRLTG